MPVVAIISLVAAYFVAKLYIPLAYVGWDESVFLYWAYRIYQAIKLGNFSNFWHLTRMQFDYPPLQSWALGIPLVPFGFSVESARIIGLSWFVLGSLLIYSIGRMLEEDKHSPIGIISSILFITSPLILLYSALEFKEMMGTTITLTLLFVYMRARENNKISYYIGVAVLLIILFMTKYNYGVLSTIAISLEAVINIFSSKNRVETIRNYLIIFLPSLVFMSWWIFTPDNKISLFINIITNPWTTMLGLTDFWGYLIFYPYAILHMCSPSVVVGIFLLVSPILTLFHFKDYRIRILWLSFVPNLILGMNHPGNMQERYLLTSIPALFIIGSYITIDLFKHLRSQVKNKVLFLGFSIIFLIMGIKIAYDLCHLPQFVYSVGSFTHKSSLFNQKTIIDQWFYYDENQWATKTWPNFMKERPCDILEYITSNVDLSKPVEVYGRANELPPDYFNLMFALKREKNDYPRLSYPSYFVTVEVLPPSIYYTKNFVWFNEFIINLFIRQVENNKSFKLINEKKFEELGVLVKIYVPKNPEATR